MIHILSELKHKTVALLKRFFGDVRWLAIWIPLALIVPNIVLSVNDPVSTLSALVNIVLPFGIFCLLMGLWRKTGVTALFMIFFMFFAAFQIVLLYLYGGSVIAVDMFLNVVTTNVSEATELLANMVNAMSVVIVLYIPPIVWGICATIKKQEAPAGFRRKMVKVGGGLTAVGVILTALTFIFVPNYSFRHETFPVNAISNMIEACHRYNETNHHDELAADFHYNAVGTHDADQREIYLFVIGETSRGDNWQLGGYERPTNPLLSKVEGLTFFRKSISESNTTHKSVPMLMSFASAEEFDSIAYYKSVLTAFREAGFFTAFVSNQVPNRSFTEHFGNEADSTIYVCSADGAVRGDDAVFEPIDKLIADKSHSKQLIVVHTYGSHFRYYDRYPRRFAHFLPDDVIDANADNRDALINAYDNSITYTDYVLYSLIDRLQKQSDTRTALLYASDHGEDIFDDARNRFLHASPVPTYYQIHQATFVWLSPTLQQQSPEMAEALQRNGSKRISPQKSLFPTVMQLAGVESQRVVDSLSVVSPRYNPAPAVYLNDLNQTLPISNCGLTEFDNKLIMPLLH